MLNLRVMEVSEIRRLHAVQMHRDFPPSELKGVETILNLCARNEYDVLAAELDARFIGYALIYRPRTGKSLLLDYLAVEPEIRNRGYGHQLLEALIPQAILVRRACRVSDDRMRAPKGCAG